ncbi:MAG: hypothetical protein K2L72_02270, partial [Clostridia bacterium]|nr:hypothetical protein [Clostridia bacterium]
TWQRAGAAPDGLTPTDFEFPTAGVMLALQDEGCEGAVVACGLGGLNDATNAINQKELAVITSLSLEHTEYLGNTIEEICAQKAGIIKSCPAVVNGYQPFEEAKTFFKNVGAVFADGVTDACRGRNKFVYGGREYRLSVSGFCQLYNAATAIEGAKILGLPEEAIAEGVMNTKPAGRLEMIECGGGKYILDGGHNECAIEPLRGYISGLDGESVTVVFGCLKDKDIDGNLRMLAGLGESIIAVKCPSPRARSLEETAEACKKYFDDVSTADCVSSALDQADTKTVVVCGSFTLLKEAREWIEKRR